MTNRCPITYLPVETARGYSPRGLSLLSRRLTGLKPLPYTANEQLHEAALRSGRMSIGGVQPKLSARLSATDQSFHLVDTGGRYILKPQNPSWPKLPENEDCTMKCAALAGIEVPPQGLVWSKDGSLTYWISRFDRAGRKGKVPVEDFSQLGGYHRDTKYDASVEKVVQIIEKYTTFPAREKARFFHRFLFDFITGNNDMHLKNYSVIVRGDVVELAPAYDLLNASLVTRDSDELALPLNGKKKNLTRNDIFNYLAKERLGLTDTIIQSSTGKIRDCVPRWHVILESSFLPEEMREQYRALMTERLNRLGLG